MNKIIKRLISIDLPQGKSAFLWGPRKVGKTYWISHHFKDAIIIDLLKTDVFADYISRPALLRERYQNSKELIIIDEIQKVPALLDEVHWLIENKGISFLLTGSSARKLRQKHANLLAGRAWRRKMVPLSSLEVNNINLEKIMISGLLPPHYLSPAPLEDIRAYVSDYLKEEIAQEALTRNIPAFADFLKVAALTSGELLNYTNVAREVGISQKVVRTYFDILYDTFLGFKVVPWKKFKNRRLIETEKFYFFDIGISNYLCRRQPKEGSPEFGKSFEHYILMELVAYQTYAQPDLEITYWRTCSGYEVDFILGDKLTAIEVKGSKKVHEGDTRGLNALQDDGYVRKSIIVALEKEPKLLEKNIEVIPWNMFVERLWAGDFI